MKYLSLIFLIAVFFWACTEEETCRESTNAYLQATFFKAGTSTSFQVDTLTINGLGKDSFLYNKKLKVSAISLPLNQQKNISTFVLKSNNINDTVTVIHTNADYFLSFACGCMITHKIDTVLTTKHFINSIIIKQYDINNQDVKHLQIYF
jgi:hypothetical protein